MSVEIKYKGNTIASASTQTTKTIKTSGKYCEADIEVINTPDGGGAPVINPLSVTANGTYNAPSGVDGYAPVTVSVPQGVFPTGNINITDTNVTDVTNYATAQVVSENLKPENIKKNIDILGIIGTFEGGGGGLPSIFNKLVGGSFTLASDTVSNDYNITHNLGEAPKGVLVWTEENMSGQTYSVRTVVFMWATAAGDTGMLYQRNTNGTGRYVGYTYNGADITSEKIKFDVSANYYKANCTYKWLAWA